MGEKRQEAPIERGVVRDEDRAAAEFDQPGNELAEARPSAHHGIIDPVDRGDEGRDRVTRIDQRFEGRDDPAAVDDLNRDLDDGRGGWIDPGRLDIDERETGGTESQSRHRPSVTPLGATCMAF